MVWISIGPKSDATFAYQEEAPSGENEMLAYELIALARHTEATRIVTYQMPNKALLQGLGCPHEPLNQGRIATFGMACNH